jgi:ubiquitin C-terminal hydrolase
MDYNKSETTSDPNIQEMLDLARKFVEDDSIIAEYYTNLALLSPKIQEKLKFQANGIKSYINYKKNNSIDIVLRSAGKILKKIKMSSNDNDSDLSILFIRSLYRAGDMILKYSSSDPYLSAFYFHTAKIYIETNEQIKENSGITNMIEENYIRAFHKICEHLEIVRENLNNREYFRILEQLKDYFNQDEVLTTHGYSEQTFLVSKLWLGKLITFLNKTDKLEKVFDRKNVCHLYFNDGINKDELKKYSGNYPGSINNIDIIQFKDFWYDPLPSEKYTNIFLNPIKNEEEHFVCLSSDIYDKIKSIFSICDIIEVERKIHIQEDNNRFYDVHLERIKVLLLSNFLYENFKNLIKPRLIQISKFRTIIDLKQKILRSLLHTIQTVNDDLQFNIRIYQPDFRDKNMKVEIQNIIYAYSNNFKSYKIDGQEITDDNILISEIKQNFLIIEITTEFDLRKSPFIRIGDEIQIEKFTCNFCENEHPVDVKLFCENCDFKFYCSIECRSKDKYHLRQHADITINNQVNTVNQGKTKIILKRKVDLSKIIECNMSSLINKAGRGGLTGLKNLGNTCFMNSALQCLSNCEELTKYFLMKTFADEINIQNKYGSGGKIAKAYYELMKELWNGTNNYLSPGDFRTIFISFAKQFAGFSQHDSHEMLAFMLDALHEDLNRVKEKPYIELKEKMIDESEEEASYRWWMSHHNRDNSILVDLFHGQLKSEINCPSCNRISITYDPFSYLCLPIPTGKSKIKFHFFTDDYDYNIKSFEFLVNDFTTIRSIKDYIIQTYFKNMSNVNIECIVTQNKMFKKFLNDSSPILPVYDGGDEIIFYQTSMPRDDQNYLTLYITPFDFKEEKSFFGNKNRVIDPNFYVKPFIFNKEQTILELHVYVFAYYRKLYQDIVLDDGRKLTLENFMKNLGDYNYLKNEFLAYFKKNINFAFYALNNIPENSKIICEYCNKSDCDSYCVLNFRANEKISALKNAQKYNRPILLLFQLTNYAKLNKIPLFNNYNSTKNQQIKLTVSIYDCLDAYRSKEKLEKENAWYCSICKDHQEAIKKLEIYSAPNILIIQFKRFRIKSTGLILGMLSNKKNDSLIDFPIDNFDLSNYIVAESEQKDAQYELIAISQHFGNLTSGHYTALCRNRGEWYHFDDERVSRSKINDVVSPAAYLLFYRKKCLNNK